jgi:hypothetical protein
LNMLSRESFPDSLRPLFGSGPRRIAFSRAGLLEKWPETVEYSR